MLKDNISLVLQRIEKACSRKGLIAGSVTLIAVTKTVDADIVRQALELGIKEIGESRIQEAGAKFSALSGSLCGVRKHLIGHLQSNKARKAAELFDLIQSVDSIELAKEINKYSLQNNKVQDCLLELKVSPEDTKFGLLPEKAAAFMAEAEKLSNVRFCGIMAMAPYFEDVEKARPFFRKAKESFEEIRSLNKYPFLKILSMGMSNDFEVAIEEGATMVRVGTALFKNSNIKDQK